MLHKDKKVTITFIFSYLLFLDYLGVSCTSLHVWEGAINFSKGQGDN